ncbi:MAG: 30S ribosomal protein S3 [Candidatus Electryoneaceae bacterium]|nr:30S ribosomal protein S3 [Candidatus Electryoneaceae bacterium]
MGQKTNPVGLRLGINKTWASNWFERKHFAEKLAEDLMLRRYLEKRLAKARVARVIIERTLKQITVNIHTASPGIVIGKRGVDVDKLRGELRTLTGKDVQINVLEIKVPELEAALVADNLAQQLAGRVSFRRAMKRTYQATRRMGAEGIKITCKGRLGGAEMARTETYKDGRIPLHTLRADIDYALRVSHTPMGTVGIKVWICKGEILDKSEIPKKEPRRKDTRRKGRK